MTKLRRRAVEAFHSLPHGGLEIGGILFGRVYPNARSPLRVELAAERPIECAHAGGPAFVLAAEEFAAIAAQLERTRLDPELSALSVVGFWVSHSRAPMALSPDDLDLYQRIFPQGWQIVLVLKPQPGGTTRAGFFFRAGGRIAPHDPQSDFFADGHAPTAPPAPDEAGAATGERYQPVARKRADDGATGLPVEIPAERPRESYKLTSNRGAALLALFLALGAGLGYYLHDYLQPSVAVKGHDPDVDLEVFPAGSELLVHWNARSRDVEDARHGELTLRDGNQVSSFPLDAALLQRGFLRYSPRGRNVSATLKLIGQDGTTLQNDAQPQAPFEPLRKAGTGR